MAVMVGVAGAEEIVASGPDDIRRQLVEAEIASALVVAWERELMDAGESARRVFLFRNAVADVRRWFELPQVRAAAEDGNILAATGHRRGAAPGSRRYPRCLRAGRGYGRGNDGHLRAPRPAFHARRPVPDEPSAITIPTRSTPPPNARRSTSPPAIPASRWRLPGCSTRIPM